MRKLFVAAVLFAAFLLMAACAGFSEFASRHGFN